MNLKSSICKIVYFDEESVTDYVQIIAEGKLEKTTELLNETIKNVKGEVNVGAKGGISGIFSALLGLEAHASADTSIGATLNTNKIAKNIVKNTILTDFIEILNGKGDKGGQLNKKIKKFKGYEISVEKDSLSYMIMVSPYFSTLNENSMISAGEFNIEAGKLDNTLKAAKGYYEFVGTKKENQVILRFNINSLKNNYKISDLLKMNLSIYAIKVGSSSLEELNFNKELGIGIQDKSKDNPSYEENQSKYIYNEARDKKLDVYDVLLAGVESDD